MTNESKNSGVGFTGLLLIAFVVLKLCNVINWSWWWVLSPAWMPLALVLIGGIVYIIVSSIVEDNKEQKAVKGQSLWQKRVEEMQEKQRKAKEMKDN